MEAAFDIGSIGVMSGTLESFFDAERTKPARSGRTNKADKIRKPIAAALRKISEERKIPIKAGEKYMGNRFLNLVNEELAAKGIEARKIPVPLKRLLFS